LKKPLAMGSNGIENYNKKYEIETLNQLESNVYN